MVEFLTTPAASVVLLLAMTAALIAVGVYVIGKVRQDLTSDTAGASELLSNFRELHSQGGLSDEEYRTIKAMLAKPLDDELKIEQHEQTGMLQANSTVGPTIDDQVG